MCCGCRMCMFCTCLILVVIAIGMLFGFGVFKKGFHSIKNDLHYSVPSGTAINGYGGRRPFLGFPAPSPL